MDGHDSDSIIDEYDREVMERLEDGEEVDELMDVMPVRTWDMPMLGDIQAWRDNQPTDEYLGGTLHHSRDTRYEICLGAVFPSKEEAIHCIQKFSIVNRVQYRVKESEPKFVVLECRDESNECPWRIRVACKKNRGYWEISRYRGDHTCRYRTMLKDNVHLNVRFIAREVTDVITEKIRVDSSEIRHRIHKDYGYDISYLKAWQAKHKAMDMVFGKWDESFRYLPQLMQALEDTNPGTFVRWDRTLRHEDGAMVVNRVFWAFGPAIEAYPYCRPVLSVDGTHLYGRYNGKLLAACGLDANNHIVPLAFALVESENVSSWKWFFRCIREGVTNRDGICVLSDRHNGILAAMRDPDWLPPRAYHRYCVRHFVSNFATKVHDGQLKDKLSLIAHERQKCKFDSSLQELLALLQTKPNTRDWLVSFDPKSWALAYDEGGVRYGSLTTNVSECFNKVLLGARDLPISALVVFTFRQSNGWFCERKEMYGDEHLFAPKVEDKLESLAEKAYFHRVRMFDRAQGLFEVTTTRKHHVHTVSLSDRVCSCGKWTLFKYPCSHVLAVCKNLRIGHEEFVDPLYTMEAYFQTWSSSFQPLGDERYWRHYEGPIHVPNPVFMRCATGRPPSTRRHNEMDKSYARSSQGEASSSQADPSCSQSRVPRLQRCKICAQHGHNRRSCPSRPEA